MNAVSSDAKRDPGETGKVSTEAHSRLLVRVARGRFNLTTRQANMDEPTSD